jgi:hypothetical protein
LPAGRPPAVPVQGPGGVRRTAGAAGLPCRLLGQPGLGRSLRQPAPYAAAAGDGRRARSRLVYTPQFLRNGRDWRSAASPLDGIGPTATRIVLELGAVPAAGQLVVDGGISEISPGGRRLACGLRARSPVAGTRRRKPRQDPASRLRGAAPDRAAQTRPDGPPFPAPEDPLEADWKRADLGIVAFVQDRKSGEVLQALQRHACGG